MLTRYGLGTASPAARSLIAMALLLLAIPLALWLAARLYRAGVLMYGQPPDPAHALARPPRRLRYPAR